MDAELPWVITIMLDRDSTAARLDIGDTPPQVALAALEAAHEELERRLAWPEWTVTIAGEECDAPAIDDTE